MTKMICMSEEEYNIIAGAVIDAHGVLCDIQDERFLTHREEDAKVNLSVAMQKIDDIDARIEE